MIKFDSGDAVIHLPSGRKGKVLYTDNEKVKVKLDSGEAEWFEKKDLVREDLRSTP